VSGAKFFTTTGAYFGGMNSRAKPVRSLLLALGLAGIPLTLAEGADASANSAVTPTRPPLRLDSEVEYYLPTKAHRSIRSIFANAAAGVSLLHGIFTFEGGITVAGAWGNIIQWDQHFNDVRLDTSVGGAGPMFLIRCDPFHVWRLSLSLDLLSAIVFYSNHFPPGGDIYNFTWRLGGALVFRVNERFSVTVGLRWMHVSNGQGLGAQNPSYEGLGFPVGLLYRF
jgi:hypothetical protein